MDTNDSPNSKSKRKRKPLGKLPALSDAELEAMAAVTPADIEAAKAAWRGNVKPQYENLLDAEQNTDAEAKPANP